MNQVMQEPMSEMMESDGPGMKYIPKQFDMDKLRELTEKDPMLGDMLYGMMVSNNSMFREETRTTLESYGLIIDQREGSINRLMND